MTEPTFNQYAAPTAQVADVTTTETGELNLFSANGRIGRVRYMAYSTGVGLVFAVLAGALTLAGPLAMLVLLLYIPYLWFTVITSIKRCHDMNISGWWTLTIIIPIIGLLWLFVPGSKDANRFGPPPPPNTTGVNVLGWMFPLMFIIGMLAAIALPQYKNYTDRAKAAQSARP